MLKNYFTFPKELVPTLNWLLLSSAPGSRAARNNNEAQFVAKLLCVSKRARTNAQLAIAFLCTRVSCSTEQDWSKLIQLLQYFTVLWTCFAFLVLTVLWVDAAYAVHDDMKSHTGGATSLGRGAIATSLGRGAIMCKSTKQKLNTKSSTEGKVVGLSGYLPDTIWVKMFFFWRNKDMSLTKTFFTRISRALSDSRRMVEHPAARSPGTLTFVISSCRTVSSPRAFLLSIVPRTRFSTKPLQGSLFRKFQAILSLPCEYAHKISATTSIRGARCDSSIGESSICS